MQTRWIPTNEYYHAMIAAPDLATRQQLYRQYFLQPFERLMQMMGGMFRADAADEFAVARAWAWLLPEQLDTVPAVLQQLEAANAWQVAGEALAEGGRRFDPYDAQIGIEQIEGWLTLADPARSNPFEDGYTGVIDFLDPRLFAQYSVPNPRNLERLPALVAHEMHHVVRSRCFPWRDISNVTVAEYVVHEGLAESFAKALYGEELVWEVITGFDNDQFNTAQQLIGAALDRRGFDVIRGYIFGDPIAASMNFDQVGMPLYGGYAVGYYVVQAYLERTGQTIEAATFEPAAKIVQESGFFQPG